VGFQPWYQHQTYPAISIPLNVEGSADNITGLTVNSFKMVIRNLATNTDTTGTGTFAITTSTPAVVTYQFSDADTLVGTNTNLIVEATFPGAGGGNAVYDPISFPFTAS
jgi:hypothetical protein